MGIRVCRCCLNFLTTFGAFRRQTSVVCGICGPHIKSARQGLLWKDLWTSALWVELRIGRMQGYSQPCSCVLGGCQYLIKFSVAFLSALTYLGYAQAQTIGFVKWYDATWLSKGNRLNFRYIVQQLPQTYHLNCWTVPINQCHIWIASTSEFYLSWSAYPLSHGHG